MTEDAELASGEAESFTKNTALTGESVVPERNSLWSRMKGDGWSSLEIAKLFVGILIPVSIAVLGIIVNKQNLDAAQAEAQRVQGATETREEAVREFNLDREDAIRIADEERSTKIREANEAREDRIRDDSVRREDAIRAATMERELAIKRADEARDERVRGRDLLTRYWNEFVQLCEQSRLYSQDYSTFDNVESAQGLEDVYLKMRLVTAQYAPHLTSEIVVAAHEVAGEVRVQAHLFRERPSAQRTLGDESEEWMRRTHQLNIKLVRMEGLLRLELSKSIQ